MYYKPVSEANFWHSLTYTHRSKDTRLVRFVRMGVTPVSHPMWRTSLRAIDNRLMRIWVSNREVIGSWGKARHEETESAYFVNLSSIQRTSVASPCWTPRKILHKTPPRIKKFRNFQYFLVISNSIIASVDGDINIQLRTSYAYVPCVIIYYLLSSVISMSVNTTHPLKRAMQTTVKITR